MGQTRFEGAGSKEEKSMNYVVIVLSIVVVGLAGYVYYFASLTNLALKEIVKNIDTQININDSTHNRLERLEGRGG
jgi:hypothetical protein